MRKQETWIALEVLLSVLNAVVIEHRGSIIWPLLEAPLITRLDPVPPAETLTYSLTDLRAQAVSRSCAADAAELKSAVLAAAWRAHFVEGADV